MAVCNVWLTGQGMNMQGKSKTSSGNSGGQGWDQQNATMLGKSSDLPQRLIPAMVESKSVVSGRHGGRKGWQGSRENCILGCSLQMMETHVKR